MVTEYKYLGCAIDEFMDPNTMVDNRAKAGRRALGSLLQGVQSAVGAGFVCLYLQETVRFYGAICGMIPTLLQ